MPNKKDKYESRKAAHICPNCGKRKPADGKITCETCIERNSKRSKRLYTYRRVSNLCVSCGTPPEPGKSLCKFCSRKRQLSAERICINKQPPCRICGEHCTYGSQFCPEHSDVLRLVLESLSKENHHEK